MDERDKRDLPSGVSVSETAADRAARANRRFRAQRQRFGEQREPCADLRRVLGRALAHERAELEAAIADLDLPELICERVDVDHSRWRALPQREKRDETLAAREDRRVGTAIAECVDEVCDRVRGDVLEWRGLHGLPNR